MYSCFVYRHIASTSAMICLLVNPERSIAPEGQVSCVEFGNTDFVILLFATVFSLFYRLQQ